MDNWIVYGSDSSKQPNFNDALNTTTRRHHSKSRKGCATCKKRRIKCDETKPACRQCIDYGRHCSFLDSPSPVNEQGTEINFEDLVDQVWTKLQARRTTNAIPDVALRRPYIRMLLDHFLHRNDGWLLGSSFQSRVQAHGMRLGLDSEYVLHAILAVTACHMYFENPANTDLHLISHYYYSLSLELYQEKLRDIRADELDPIYVCGTIQIVLTIRFTLLEAMTGTEMLNGFEVLLAAIRTMNNFPALSIPFRGRPEVSRSVFRDLFDRCNFPAHIGLDEEMSAPEPSSIAPLEGLVRSVAGDEIFDKIYQEPFAYLVRISNQEVNTEYLDTYMSFSSQLKDGYLEALECKEPLAILLLCYWFALLTRIQQWWITEPARTFCQRLYMHLLGALPIPVDERSALLSPAAAAISW